MLLGTTHAPAAGGCRAMGDRQNKLSTEKVSHSDNTVGMEALAHTECLGLRKGTAGVNGSMEWHRSELPSSHCEKQSWYLCFDKKTSPTVITRLYTRCLAVRQPYHPPTTAAIRSLHTQCLCTHLLPHTLSGCPDGMAGWAPALTCWSWGLVCTEQR